MQQSDTSKTCRTAWWKTPSDGLQVVRPQQAMLESELLKLWCVFLKMQTHDTPRLQQPPYGLCSSMQGPRLTSSVILDR